MTPPLSILVVAEPWNSERRIRATQAALEFARLCAGLVESRVSILTMDHEVHAHLSPQLLAEGIEILGCEVPEVGNGTCEQLTPTLSEVARGFDIVVATATTFGKDAMPRVAARLGAAFIADCIDIRHQHGRLEFQRAMHGGSILGWCASTAARTVISVRESRFRGSGAYASGTPSRSSLYPTQPSVAAKRIRVLARRPLVSTRPDLLAAEVVVSGGRPLGERFEAVLGPLADCLGGALGATRALCDAGHAPTCLQVGQTGQVIAPRLYIAVGVSGSMQHVAGMRGSNVVVAINRDPFAPIFEVADFGLVADLFDCVPKLVAHLSAR